MPERCEQVFEGNDTNAVSSQKKQQQNKTVEENTRIAWISHITSSPAYSLIQALREWRLEVMSEIQATVVLGV